MDSVGKYSLQNAQRFLLVAMLNPKTGCVGGNIRNRRQPIHHASLEAEWITDEEIAKNMALWKSVHKTDRSYTKKDHNDRTSISTQYRFMQATKAFGPIGIGWGYEILREWTTEGAPIVVEGRVTEFREIIHHCEVALWFKYSGEKSEPIVNYGDTRQLYYTRGYQNKPGYFVNDDEVHKKSLSDALGKCLSMIGVCADVYLGEHDNDHIETITKFETESKDKLRVVEEEQRIRDDVMAKLETLHTEMESAQSKAKANEGRAKALAVIHALPDISREQQDFKSKVIRRVELLFKDICERIEKTKAEKATANAEKEPDKPEQTVAEA